MPNVRHQIDAPTRTLRLASGDRIPAHRHDDHQIVYAGRGVLAVTTDRGSWVAVRLVVSERIHRSFPT